MLLHKNVILNVLGSVMIIDVMLYVPQFVNPLNVIQVVKNQKLLFAMLNAKGNIIFYNVKNVSYFNAIMSY